MTSTSCSKKRKGFGRAGAVIGLFVVFAVLAACSEDDGREALPDWSDGFEDTSTQGDDDDGGVPIADASTNDNIIEGLTSDIPDDAFGLGIPADVVYPVRLRKLNTILEPCAIREGEAGEITCIMEMNEFDIDALGITYDIVTPGSLCDFVLYESYMFENWQIGVGPTHVSWTVDGEGNLSDEVNAQDGEPECQYDYTEIYGPNCCLGEYTQTVTQLNEEGEVQNIETMHGEWGGKLSDCYEGAAFLDIEAVFSESGFPMSKYIYVNRQATINNVQYDILSDKYAVLSDEYFGTTVPLANYWDPADHDGGVPAAFTGGYSEPYYEFECVDDAWEVVARIHLLVREWNQESEFDTDGDPDTTGTEPGWNHPFDDLADWAVLTPGGQTYPQIYSARLQ